MNKILIADDETTFRMAAADLLRIQGYECKCVNDANSAIETLKSEKFDLLIADINMPGNHELELIKQLPEIAEGLPVILLTGGPIPESKIQSLKPPVTACLNKPPNFQQLLTTIEDSIKGNSRL